MKLGGHQSEETKKKISAALKGNTRNLGNHASTETRARLSASGMGHVVSPETREKISVAKMGHSATGPKHHTAEARKKMSVAMLGTHLSPETRAKLSAGMMGHVMHPEIRAKISLALSGSQSYLWKGGITPEQTRIRHSIEYRTWRTAVFERDNYTCQGCGQYGGELNAHHIHEFAKYPEERFVIENGKTLCVPCHDKMRMTRGEA